MWQVEDDPYVLWNLMLYKIKEYVEQGYELSEEVKEVYFWYIHLKPEQMRDEHVVDAG